MDNKTLRFISWNVNGLNSRGHEVHYYATKHDVDVILLQETRDRVGDALKLNGYKKYQLLANDGIRGLATFVKSSIPSELIEEPYKESGVESVSVRVHVTEGSLNVINLYVSANCFDPNVLPNSLFSGVTLVAGDLNARHRALEKEGNGNMNGTKVSNIFTGLSRYQAPRLNRCYSHTRR